MVSYKKDFPIFANNPGLVFLDSAASAQKPTHVIQGMAEFMSTSYANIHRWMYGISEQAEELYYASKTKYAKYIWANEEEIIYTYNATYAYNMLAETLWYSWVLKAWDTILVDIAEHHANIVPWQMLSQRHGVIVQWIDLDEDYDYSLEDFKKKYTEGVKVVSLSAASNVTGTLYANLKTISTLLRPDTFFIVDGSQAAPHGCINVVDLRADAMVATGHKLMADTGIGMLYLKKEHIKTLVPARGWGGMIEDVTTTWYKPWLGRHKFEPGTPHIIGAVSLLKALEYIESIWWCETLRNHEQALIAYALERIAKNPKITLLGKKTAENRLGIFSIVLETGSNHTKVGEFLAQHNVCVRCGGHCTHPLFHQLQYNGSCRISIHLYNDIEDLTKCFDLLETL